jgi:hypothetical protein
MPVNSSSSTSNINQRKTFDENARAQVQTQVLSLAQGNPGAITLLARVARENGFAIASLLCDALKNQNIQGPDVWIRYNDNCGSDINKFIDMTLALDTEGTTVQSNQVQSPSKSEPAKDEMLTGRIAKSSTLPPSTVQGALQKPNERNG